MSLDCSWEITGPFLDYSWKVSGMFLACIGGMFSILLKFIGMLHWHASVALVTQCCWGKQDSSRSVFNNSTT
jgi:hypothetical protein